MQKLKAKLLAFPAAEIHVFSNAKKRLLKLFHQEKVEYVNKEPDILVFLSGGSERVALQSVQEFGFYLLVASRNDNSWAAATEVKAWMNENNVSSILLDQNSSNAIEAVNSFYLVKNGIRRLKGQRFGLIGTTSDWLVNSTIDPFIIKAKLGIEQVNISWEDIDVVGQNEVASDFINFFKCNDIENLKQSGKVYEALSKVVSDNELNAITVECFSLVSSCNATACLALSKLSMDGVPAGCEGDICSIIGMMLAKEIFGIVPWIANIAHVSDNKLTLAHCTIPANLLKDFTLDSHFETDKGLAINGRLKTQDVTIFRIDHSLSKLFVGYGKILESPHQKSMCRTQVVIDISTESQKYFMENPLGNHHLVLPGNHLAGMELVARILNLIRV